MWDLEIDQFLTITTTAQRFKLDQKEVHTIVTMIISLPYQGKHFIQQHNLHVPIDQWIGCFESGDLEAHPLIVVHNSQYFARSLMNVHRPLFALRPSIALKFRATHTSGMWSQPWN